MDGYDDSNKAHGVLFVAVRGQGCFQRSLTDPAEKKVTVSPESNIGNARFCESVDGGHSDQTSAADIASQLGITSPPLRMDSQCKYAAIAGGYAEIYLRVPVSTSYEENIWDHASGALLVSEAGGLVCDIRGEPLDFTLGRTLRANKGIIATNGHLHHTVLVAARKVLAKI